MARIDDKLPFLPVNIAVLTISDTRTLADDRSGDRLVDMITRDGHKVAKRAIVTADGESLEAALKALIAVPTVHCICTPGRTGVTGPAGAGQAYGRERGRECGRR